MTSAAEGLSSSDVEKILSTLENRLTHFEKAMPAQMDDDRNAMIENFQQIQLRLTEIWQQIFQDGLNKPQSTADLERREKQVLELERQTARLETLSQELFTQIDSFVKTELDKIAQQWKAVIVVVDQK